MIKNIVNYLSKHKVGVAILAMAVAVAPRLAPAVNAAADADFAAALASSTGVVNDNTGSVFSYLIGIWGKGFLIGVLLALLGLTAAIIIGAIFRRRKGKK